ncbi:DNA-binding protein [Klebsiella pneumoniae]|nr:DNA-binding protein [Klebsiella pneumoniae]
MINYLTAKDAAEYLSVCLSRFYQLKRYIPSFPPYINQTINGRKRRVWLASSLYQFSDRFLGGRK